jgi:hypothetical protein
MGWFVRNSGRVAINVEATLERPLLNQFEGMPECGVLAARWHSRSAEIDGFAVVQPRIGQQRSG